MPCISAKARSRKRDTGTLFLDVVGELSSALQAQLLRVVQEQTYKRIGGNQRRRTRFRLISATNRNLDEEISNGCFRQDLYYRLATHVIHVPPLRERGDDVLLLARHFLKELLGFEPMLDRAVSQHLMARSYEGNIRELKQLAMRIAARHAGPGPITIGDLPDEERLQGVGIGYRARDLEDAVRSMLMMGFGLKDIGRAASDAAIRAALIECDGSVKRAAKVLGVTDRALHLRASLERKLSVSSTFSSRDGRGRPLGLPNTDNGAIELLNAQSKVPEGRFADSAGGWDKSKVSSVAKQPYS